MRVRLKRRLPVRLRQHWRVVAAGCAFLLIVGLGFGTGRIRPIVTSDSRADVAVVTVDIAGTVDVFDLSVPHEITISYAEDDYQRMLDEYFATGEKNYLEASVVIDGTAIASVGIRLKGNSTLASLTRDGERPPNSMGDGGFGERELPEGFQPRDGQAQDGGAQDGGDLSNGGFPGGGENGGLAVRQLSIEEPEHLPWLIKFDEYVAGQRYQGWSELAVRPAGPGSDTSLNEAVALSLAARTGEPSQQFAYSSFTVNDRPTIARLILEHPDQAYAESLPGDGVLYKGRAGGQFADQGDDPTEYQDDFKQLNKEGSQDLQPVIDLIQWVEHASDAEFAAGLADRVEVESLARYIAFHELVNNFDDMAGPGGNYYLYYNLDTGKFTVITWDLNLALIGMGGMGGRPGAGGFQPPEGMELPEGFHPPGDDGQAPGDGQGPGDGPGFGGGGNALKRRFLENAEFNQLYEQALSELRERLYGSGAALDALAVATEAALAAGVDSAAVESEATTLRGTIEAQTNPEAQTDAEAQAGPEATARPEAEPNPRPGADPSPSPAPATG